MAHALFLDQGRRTEKLLCLLPYGMVTVIWWAIYRSLGYGTGGLDFYLDPGAETLRFLAAIPERAPLLLLTQVGFFPLNIYHMLDEGTIGAVRVGVLGVLILIGIVIFPLLRRDARARFWTLGMVMSLVPICAVYPHDRLLFFVGLGGMGLLAQFLDGFFHGASWLSGRLPWRLLARVLAFLFVFVHGILSPLLLPLSAWSPALSEPFTAGSAASVSLDPTIEQQDLVIVNPPSAFLAQFFLVIRTLNEQPSPDPGIGRHTTGD